MPLTLLSVVLVAIRRFKPIALLTDFGLADHYVSVVKGVVRSISPSTEIIDITHEVPAFDVRTGAFFLLQASKYLPGECVVMAAVDPGVNTKRKSIIVQTKRRVYVGPDNGLLCPAAYNEGIVAVHEIRDGRYLLSSSGTFAGRDIFAPVAAYISSGTEANAIGERIDGMVALELLRAKFTRRSVEGFVLHVDRFGNIITDVDGDRFHAWRRKTSSFLLQTSKEEVKVSLFASHQELVGVGLLVGSSGTIELSAREGRPWLTMRPGDGFTIRPDI